MKWVLVGGLVVLVLWCSLFVHIGGSDYTSKQCIRENIDGQLEIRINKGVISVRRLEGDKFVFFGNYLVELDNFWNTKGCKIYGWEG